MIRERLLQWVKSVGANVKIINTYGPTEATVAATMCDLSKLTTVLSQARNVAIGRAISNVRLYVLDQYFNPVLVGISGELFIGGAGLARGYLNQPQLNAEKFIPSPLNKEPGARLYKTGHLVRYLPDGNIEFLGRVDHQEKIRGFRIELGEVETVLLTHPQIHSCVVAAQRTETEELLAIIWIHVLNVKQISIYDNFFELGGHSLMATQIVSRIRGWFDIKMPLRVVFEHPTITGQAEYIENEVKDLRVTEIVSRSSVSDREEFTF